MEITLDLDEIKASGPNIFFSEWIVNKPARIRIFNLLGPEIKIVDNTTYYIFKGVFEKDNFLGVLPEVICNIWITKQCFTEEIARKLNFWKMEPTPVGIDASFDLIRRSKNRIEMRGFKVNH